MQFFDPNNPNEKKKLIIAAALGIAALGVLGYVFLGGSSSKKPPTNRPTVARATPSPARAVKDQNQVDSGDIDISTLQPVRFIQPNAAVSEPDRNIFAFYEPPPPTPKTEKPTPTPTPAPTPPLIAAGLTPQTVFAGTPSDFSLQVMGDKFTPAVRIVIDGREMPTRFVNNRQIATTVPAAMIANPGTRQIIVRSSDGVLYSNTITLSVAPPPVPNYSYVGIIARPRGNDTAVLQDKNSKELKNVQRGELLAGRFRVSSISQREVLMIDTALKIQHRIPFSFDPSVNPQGRRSLDDEP